MFTVETSFGQVLSVHFTRQGAKDAMNEWLKKERVVHVGKVPTDVILNFAAAIVLFAGIGVMLAWRG